MKILQISPGGVRIPPDRAGGPEGHIFSMSKQLSRMAHEVTILDRKHSLNDDSFEQVEGVNIVRLPVKYFNPSALERGHFPFLYWIRGSLNTLFSVIKVNEYLKQADKFDAINTYVISATFLLIILNREIREKIFYTHATVSWQLQSRAILNRLISLLGAFTLKRVKGIIVESDTVRSHFVTYLKLPEQKVATIPAGMDIDLFSPDIGVSEVKEKYQLGARQVVLFVGRIHREKGIEYLIEAANILVNQYNRKNALFLVVGDVEGYKRSYEIDKPRGYAGKIFNLISSLELEANVKLTGYVPSDELRRLYLACDIFVLPSVVEQFGQAITEAMASGKPVVATKTPGALMQIKDGWNGFLVEIGNKRELADKIKYLLDNPEEAGRMRANAREFVQKFDWSIVAPKYVEAYQS